MPVWHWFLYFTIKKIDLTISWCNKTVLEWRGNKKKSLVFWVPIIGTLHSSICRVIPYMLPKSQNITLIDPYHLFFKVFHDAQGSGSDMNLKKIILGLPILTTPHPQSSKFSKHDIFWFFKYQIWLTPIFISGMNPKITWYMSLGWHFEFLLIHFQPTVPWKSPWCYFFLT